MATADVIVLRSTDDDRGARGPAGGAVPESWPATWLPDLLRHQPEQEDTDDDVVHRYRGPRGLYTAGCRYVDVVGSHADPTTVRLVVVWEEDGPSAKDRAAFLSWWTAQSGRAGWQPADTDEPVGAVVVARYAPTEKSYVDGSGRAYVRHDWEQRTPPRTSRTSGRRT